MQKNAAGLCSTAVIERILMVCLVLALPVMERAQDKGAPTNSNLTGRYEGAAKNSQQADITVALELAEKDGTVTGMIRSSHGDFTITDGTHKGNDVTLDFDTGGPVGTMTLKIDGDKMAGSWAAGDDEGPIEVKKAPAQADAPKGKS